MNWKILNNSPFADSRKCSVAGAAITAGASLVGSGISAASVSGHSHQNRVLARWQTEKQYQLAQEQMAAQKEMYHHSVEEQRYIDERNRQWQLADIESERAYNDPKAVAARLKAAGINPALAMQGGAGSMLAGSGYNSPSMPSPSSAPTGSVSASATPVMPPETRPYDLGAGVSQAVQDFMSMIGLESDVQRKNVQNANETAQTEANINKLQKDGELSEVSAEKLKNDLYEARETFRIRSQGLQINNDMATAEVAYKKAQTEFVDFQKRFTESNIKLNNAQRERISRLLPFEASQMVASAQQLLASARFSNISADDINNTFEARLRVLKAQAKQSISNAAGIEGNNERQQKDFDNVWKHYIEPILGDVMKAVGIAAGLYTGGRAASAAKAVPPPSAPTAPSSYGW